MLLHIKLVLIIYYEICTTSLFLYIHGLYLEARNTMGIGSAPGLILVYWNVLGLLLLNYELAYQLSSSIN